MPIEITMPRLSDTMEEGTLVRWLVKPGDTVSASDHIADVETDKATMELNVFDEGMVAKLAIEEGGTVPVGSLIAVLAEDGESVEDAAKAAGSGTPASNGAAKTDAPAPATPAAPTPPAAGAAGAAGRAGSGICRRPPLAVWRGPVGACYGASGLGQPPPRDADGRSTGGIGPAPVLCGPEVRPGRQGPGCP